ncbi:hypothetical protein [Paenibacillus qinlingensis]|uniref:hypothetical protein n=1 Tax=Paenibacillus qinlingensis TaxID=1837343 RepID=UPI0015651C16|nr:hypothetical protein [Paenibacillus qinlingensis]NQX58552.1 hypothetical protein [Paenibacillus qinlingensis]
MKIEQLKREYSIRHWAAYKPSEVQYTKFMPFEILAALKIEDVYTQVFNARSSLLFMEVDDYGKIVTNTDQALVFIRSKFLMDALACYNYAIDLSWQTLYLYYGNNSYNILLNRDEYYKALQGCNHEVVRYYLRLANQNKTNVCVTDFFNNPTTREVREAYNYIKHRGTFNIEGMKNGNHRFPLEINGLELQMAHRDTIVLEDWKNKLINFDIKFHGYFNSIITSIMSADFTDGMVTVGNVIGLLERLGKEIDGFESMDITKLGFNIDGVNSID